MKLQIGDKVLNDKTNRVGVIVDWYIDDDGDDEHGRPIHIPIPVVRYSDGSESITREWHLKKVDDYAK